MIVASTPARDLNMSEGRGLVKNKFSKLLGGGPRSALQHKATPYDSTPPSSESKSTFFRRAKSISSTSISSYANATHESLVASPKSEYSGASSSNLPAQKSTAGPSRSNSSSVGGAPSRLSTYSSMSRTSPPSPTPVYASFGFEDPVKKPSRPLPLDPKKQKAKGTTKKEFKWRSVRSVKSSDQRTLISGSEWDPKLTMYPVSDISSRPAGTVASSSSDDVPNSLLRGNANLNVATPKYSVDGIVFRSNDWTVRNGQSSRWARLSRVDDEGDDVQIVTTSSRPLSTASLDETPMTPFTKELLKVPSVGELRQRNKNKLARTLGEDVPEDLLRRWYYEEDKKGYGGVEETPRGKLDKMAPGGATDKDDGEELPDGPRPKPFLAISISPNPPPVRPSSSTSTSTSTATAPSPIVFMPRNIPHNEISLEIGAPSFSGAEPSSVAFKPYNTPVGGLNSPIDTPPTLTLSEPDTQGIELNKESPDEGQWIARRSNLPSRSSSLLVRPSSVTGNYTPSPPLTPKSTSEFNRNPTDTNHNRGTSEQIFGSMPSPLYRSASVLERSQRTYSPLSSPILPDSSVPFASHAIGSGQFLTPEATTNVTLSGVQRRDRSHGWSGEWNQDDMQDVIRKLRDLR